MNKILFTLLIAIAPMTSFAEEGDLVLPGAKWVAKFDKFVCAAFGPAVSAPSSFADINVKFERIVTDSSLDNGLITANFTEEGSNCRYSAIIFADNAASTSKLVQSKAFSTAGVTCEKGKAIIDAALLANDYLYYGHPHNLAMMAPVDGAKQVCGSNLVGINFVVTGKL